MRKYLICYLVERNDECQDLEQIIMADNLETALIIFTDHFRVYKRITSITEQSNVSQYPKIVEISKQKQPFKVDIKDPNFDKPISELNKEY